MPGSFYASSKLKINYGNMKIKKGYCGSDLIYTCGNSVTYVVNGTNYEEDVEEGESVLSPTTFTPTKSGWTFRGWSKQAGSTIIQNNLLMGENPITLYAVWSKESSVPDQPLSMSYDGPASGCNLNPGGNWTATASVDNADINNGSTGFVYLSISVGGTTGRSWTSDAIPSGETDELGNVIYRYEQTEDKGTAGYGGKTFSINGSGNITANANRTGGYGHSGGEVHISNIVRKGYSEIEWSVG